MKSNFWRVKEPICVYEALRFTKHFGLRSNIGLQSKRFGLRSTSVYEAISVYKATTVMKPSQRIKSYLTCTMKSNFGRVKEDRFVLGDVIFSHFHRGQIGFGLESSSGQA